jgi:hypothetical protein
MRVTWRRILLNLVALALLGTLYAGFVEFAWWVTQ